MADSKLSTTSSHSSGLPIDVTPRGFSALRHNGSYSDVVLQIGSTKYQTHKLILAANSPVFQKMFSGNWKENSEDCVVLDETPECEEVFGILLDSLYQCNDGIKPLNRDNIEAVVSLADKYEVKDVTELCCKFIETLIGDNDVNKEAITWLSFAEKRQLKSVIKRCYDAICWNFQKVSKDSEWKTLTSEQLLTILRRNDVIVENEYIVFCATIDWLSENDKHDKAVESCVSDIISCIEFRNMDSDQLIDVYNKFQTWEILSAFQCHVDTAIGFRNLEDDSGQLAIAVHRRYSTEMKKALATHMNSATLSLDIPWPLSEDEMILQLSCSYSSDDKELVFKICVFKEKHTPAPKVATGFSFGQPASTTASRASHARFANVTPAGVSQPPVASIVEQNKNSNRISGYIFMVTKTQRVIQHVLQCNKVANNIDKLADGDVIVEFPGIRCVNMGQFDGHYLGKFDIFYKIVVKSHTLI